VRTNAATPAAIGAANDVPEPIRVRYNTASSREMMSSPGAATSMCSPHELKSVRLPFQSVAPTASTSG
jgi:hypothetical protein